MTTYRLLRQTGRGSRYAVVTVDVELSGGPDVEVVADVPAGYRRESELGARWALRGLATSAKITVTDVVVREMDTGVGDVYEATARCVWEALQLTHSARYVGFSDPALVASWFDNMLGQRLDAVTEARHWYEGQRGPDAESLIDAWLQFEQAMPLGLHVRGDEFLLAKDKPCSSYDMGPYGKTKVGPASSPDVLAGFVGAVLLDGAVITGSGGDPFCAGLVLRFDRGDLVVGALADEWVLASGEAPEAVAGSWRVGQFVRGTPR